MGVRTVWQRYSFSIFQVSCYWLIIILTLCTSYTTCSRSGSSDSNVLSGPLAASAASIPASAPGTGSAIPIRNQKNHYHYQPPVVNTNGMVENEDYWREVKAIVGGVLGFWGGVGSMGTLFLVIVISQRYCCRKDDDEKDGEG